VQSEGSLRKRGQDGIRRAGEDPRNEERKQLERNEKKQEGYKHVTNINGKHSRYMPELA
jgi:hypothetical protein